ncbi:hypothetical protein ACHAXH_008804 [Discostella pseudostelligera]
MLAWSSSSSRMTIQINSTGKNGKLIGGSNCSNRSVLQCSTESIPPNHNESTVGHRLPHSGKKFLLDMLIGGGGAHNIDGDYLLFDALFGLQVGSCIGDIIGYPVQMRIANEDGNEWCSVGPWC